MKRHARNNRRLIAAAALGLLAAAQAGAQTEAAPAATVATAAPAAQAAGKTDKTKDELTALPSAEDFRPNGPANISGNHLESVKGDTSVTVLTGNVTLDSDTLKMDGDRLEMKKFPDGGYTAKITGSPAHMAHAGNGPDNPPVTAHSKTMTYDSRTAMIDLVGDALLTKGDQKITAQTMSYNVRDKSYQADRGDGGNGRVIIVVPPQPASASAPKPATAPRAQAAPAPAAPPATTSPQPAALPSPPPAP
jgi:lipopolysaccharide export system protein LptA